MNNSYILKKRKGGIWEVGEKIIIKTYNENEEGIKSKKKFLKYFKEISKKDKILICDVKNKLFQVGIAIDKFKPEVVSGDWGSVKIKIIDNREDFKSEFNKIFEKFKVDFLGFTFKPLPEKLDFILKNEIIIEDVMEYLKKVEKLNLNKKNIIYRGQANKTWGLLPSIYRENYYIDKEKEIYKSIRRHNFKEFKTQEQFLNEIIHMQHYGIPTCLLDWTKNSLIALFFAVSNKPDSDGKVFVNIPEMIYEFDEEEYENLSIILEVFYGKNKKNDKDNLDVLVNQMYKSYITGKNFYFINPILENMRIRVQAGLFSLSLVLNENIFTKVRNRLVKKIFIENIEDIERRLLEEHYQEEDDIKFWFNEIKSSQKIIVKVYNCLSENKDINFIIDEIEIRSSERGKEGKNIIEKILRCIFSVLKHKVGKIKESLILENDSRAIKKSKCKLNVNSVAMFVIPKDNKEKIQKQLDKLFDINSVTVYPDVEGYVQYIKDKFNL
ncbi:MULTISPECIES: FRG domain-containing protein [unclassified Candidatus Frackibacter]|uniref:FRG domain-containing protein n=1 Tax=unclassified Candidatus Frackibacter TaxID=2648818 RepID=UPI00088F1D16|nr:MULTISPECIES: FRG domain-containing protein [unclassified Candidatus Frackibacter]SDC30745.1 FRG domain-containing protein [Candidatus Frackibacter sp. WG11]SEM74003.1 FRG domain-containing protein [Candidatus Frackibacter sp. WG12]SFL58600.1 FRG domain-containing protein [Candidatus Frackibacter sp. WG13]